MNRAGAACRVWRARITLVKPPPRRRAQIPQWRGPRAERTCTSRSTLTRLETTDLWRKISFFVCIPGIAVCALWTYKAEMAHKAHVEHEKEHGEERKVYDYMNMRTKVSPDLGSGGTVLAAPSLAESNGRGNIRPCAPYVERRVKGADGLAFPVSLSSFSHTTSCHHASRTLIVRIGAIARELSAVSCGGKRTGGGVSRGQDEDPSAGAESRMRDCQLTLQLGHADPLLQPRSQRPRRRRVGCGSCEGVSEGKGKDVSGLLWETSRSAICIA